MRFDQIIGQQSIKQQLGEMAQSERVPHALLFMGPSGCGKLATAMAFAQYLLCQNRQASVACGTCNQCLKAAKLVHPDIHFSFPVVGSKVTSADFMVQWRTAIAENPYLNITQWMQVIDAENKQANINKDECLRIVKQLSLTIFEGKYKILIMWLPEYLGKEGNRLLKLIEEPPEKTIFLLVAEHQERILNTILSRCQLLNFKGLADKDIIKVLVEQNDISETDAQAAAHLANGNLNSAISLTKHVEKDHAPLFLDWLRKCYVGNGVELVDWVSQFAAMGREQQKHFLLYGMHFIREYMVLKLTKQENIRLRANELLTAQKLTKIITFSQIEPLTKLLNDCYYYIERNANPKILFLDTSIQLHKLFKNKNQ